MAIAPNTTYNLDLNNDGVADFVIVQHSYPGYSATLMVGNNSRGVFARPGIGSCNCDSAFALPAGVSIGAGKPFYGEADLAKVRKFHGSIQSFGQWRDATERYLGLQFQIDGKTHYGWARFNVQASYATGVTATLTGYAYETIANKAIRSGKSAGGAQDLAGDAEALGSLALGAAR